MEFYFLGYDMPRRKDSPVSILDVFDVFELRLGRYKLVHCGLVGISGEEKSSESSLYYKTIVKGLSLYQQLALQQTDQLHASDGS